MINKEQINRINELARKQKAEGLNDEEKKEQETLRTLYRNAVKENLRSQIKNIKVVSQEEYDAIHKNDECNHEHHHEHGCSCGCEHNHTDKDKIN